MPRCALPHLLAHDGPVTLGVKNGRVRLTEFWSRMERKFGRAYASSYAADQVLQPLGGRTVQEALADGEDAKTVWRAVVEATGSPASER